jgi:hypothetical protein
MNEVTEVLHKIEAKLYPNYLGKGEGAYVARSKAEAGQKAMPFGLGVCGIAGQQACGVWFVNQADGTWTKVAENLAVNRPAEVVALVPALSAGKYKLEIVTQHSSGGAVLKAPRTIAAEPELTVA